MNLLGMVFVPLANQAIIYKINVSSVQMDVKNVIPISIAQFVHQALLKNSHKMKISVSLVN